MKKMKAVLAVALCLAMLFSLAACGGNKTPEKTEEPEVTATPEYVYQAEFTPLEMTGDASLWPLCFTDEGFYATSSHYVEPTESEEGAEEAAEGDEAAEADETALGGTMTYEYYFVSYDGEKTLLPIETSPVAENTENRKYFSADNNIAALLPQEDGTLLAIEQCFLSYYDGPDGVDESSMEFYQNFYSEQSYILRHLNADGTEISSIPLTTPEGVYLSTSNAVMDENGNLVLGTSDQEGGWGLISFSPEGETLWKQSLDDYVQSLLKLRDGTVAAASYGMNGLELTAIDSATGKFTESYELPNDAWNLIPGGGDYDLYYTSGVKLYGYKLGAEEPDFILDWVSCDVNGDSLGTVYVAGDGTISAIVNNYRGQGSHFTMSYELAHIAQVPYESVPQKTHLTLACVYSDSNVLNMVIDFNRSHDNCRIDVMDYSEFNTEDDYTAGRTKLETELAAGNMPDLLSMNGLPYEQLASKGLLEDLYPYLDSDKDLSREDIFANVLQAMEVDGGLYQICSSFTLNTIAGPKQIVGDRNGWTYQDVLEALSAMPEGCEILGYGTSKDSILRTCLAMDMENLVDWSEGQCHFDSPEFIEMLEFANRFKDEANYDNYDDTVDSDAARIAAGKQLLVDVYLSDYTGFQQYDYYFGGTGTAAYIGFPTSDGSSGSALSLDSGYAMGKNCADKDAAWEFLRGFLTGEGDSWGFSVNKKLFQEYMKDAMTPYYQTDINGDYVLDEDGNRIEESHMSVGFGSGEMIEIYAMTQEQADQLTALIESATKTMRADDQVDSMVSEEAQAYFKGQKSAEEVAKLIQSKVNIYVNEQK